MESKHFECFLIVNSVTSRRRLPLTLFLTISKVNSLCLFRCKATRMWSWPFNYI